MNKNFNPNKNSYTKSYLSKHLYSPARSMIVTIKRAKNYVDPTPTTPTTPSAVTASAIKCPGCTGKLSHLASNPYITIADRAAVSFVPAGGPNYYPHNAGGVIRFFDKNGNEWLDVPDNIRQMYEALYL